MIYSIPCPSCSGEIFIPTPPLVGEEFIDIGCLNCHAQMTVRYFSGEMAKNSLTLALLPMKDWRTAPYGQVPHRLSTVVVRNLIDTAHNFNFIGVYLASRLAFLINRDRDSYYPIFNVRGEVWQLGLRVSILTACAVLVVLLKYPFRTTLPFALLCGIIIGVLTAQLYRVSFRKFDASKERQLSEEQTVLKQLYSIVKQLERNKGELTRYRQLIARFEALALKMKQADNRGYKRNILVLEHGLKTLTSLVATCEQERQAFVQLKSRLEFSYETSCLAEQLPEVEVIQAQIFGIQHRLEILEQHKAELELQANSLDTLLD